MKQSKRKFGSRKKRNEICYCS